GHEGAGAAVPSAERRRWAPAAWLYAVALAALLGIWSFEYGMPGGGQRHGPLDEAGVRRVLAGERASTFQASRLSGRPSDSESGTASRTAAPSGSPTRAPAASRAMVGFPHGIAAVECLPGGDVRLLSWSPAEGYTADEVAAGPAKAVTIELEPPGDDAGDLTVVVRCRAGEPHAAVTTDDADDADDAEDTDDE
ncbi:MAG: hypothetical protein ACRDP3_19265, partial [Streptomyces sp.]